MAKEHDSTVELSATNCTDFELLASAGEDLVWKYKDSLWFADFEFFASTEEELVWKLTKSLLISRSSDSLQRTMPILNRL